MPFRKHRPTRSSPLTSEVPWGYMEHVIGLQGDDSDTDDLLCSSDSSNSLSSSNSLDHDRLEQCWPSEQPQPSSQHEQHWADPACEASVDRSAQPHPNRLLHPALYGARMTSIQHTTYTHTHRHVSGCLCSSRRGLFRVPDGTTIRVTRSPPLLPLKQALPYLERQYASHLLSLRPA